MELTKSIYPLQASQATYQQIMMSNITGESLPPPIFVTTPYEFAISSANNFSRNNGFGMNLDFKLKYSKEYKRLKRLMPPLRIVPNISKYRTNKANQNNLFFLNNEILQYGYIFEKNEVFFHGGNWPITNLNNIIGTSFNTNIVLSTTLCANVASVHASYHPKPWQIWVITIGNNFTKKAFVYNNHPRQFLYQEKEIIFEIGVKLTCKSQHVYGNFQILEVLMT